MSTSIASPKRTKYVPPQKASIQRHDNKTLQKNLMMCGVLSSLLYVAMNIVAAILYDGYNSVTQTVSELSAIGAPTRILWLWSGLLYELLIIVFGWGVWQSARDNRPLRIAGALLLAYGIFGLFWPFAPMHQREVLVAGGATISDTLHIVFSIIEVPLMMFAIGFAAAALSKRFAIYSMVTLLIMVVFGALTGIDGPKIAKNLPTPWIGVWERILISAFLLWIIVLAIVLLKSENKPVSRNQQL